MAVICADTYQLSVHGTVAGRPWANVFHTLKLGATPPDVADAAQLMLDTYCSTLCSNLHQDVTVLGCNYVDLDSDDGESGDYTTVPGDNTGDITGDMTPVNTCFLVQWSASGGRRYRNGRTYLPGVPEGAVNNAGGVSSGYRTDLGSNINDFLGDLFDGDLQLCIVSKATEVDWIPRSISGGAIAATAATQRRRMRG